MKAINKVVYAGATKDKTYTRSGKEWGEAWHRLYLFVKVVKHEMGWKLSISGVHGPTRNGDAWGGCGQCDDALRAVIAQREQPDGTSLSVKDMERLLEVWERWHLNDMRAGCVHQREVYDTSKQVEFVTYKLTTAAYMEQKAITDKAEKLLKAGQSVKLTEEECGILNLDWERHTAPDADSVASGRYEVKSREMKHVGWLKPSEHPEGLLQKECAMCGYKYGSAWLFENLPDDVVAFLDGLPASSELDGTAWSR